MFTNGIWHEFWTSQASEELSCIDKQSGKVLSTSLIVLSLLFPVIARIATTTTTAGSKDGEEKIFPIKSSKSQIFCLIFFQEFFKNILTKKRCKSDQAEQFQLSKFELTIPEIEVTQHDSASSVLPSYVSLAEVDHSNIDPGAMTPSVETPNSDFPDSNMINKTEDQLRSRKTLSFSEPFISLTSFDARTKPEPINIPTLSIGFFLFSCSLYNLIKGLQLGRDVQKIDTEVEPLYMIQLIRTSLVSFSTGIIIVTRDHLISVKALFTWLLIVSSFHLLGAVTGVFLVSSSGICINLLFGAGYSIVAGLLLQILFLGFLAEDVKNLNQEPTHLGLFLVFLYLLGAAMIIITTFLA